MAGLALCFGLSSEKANELSRIADENDVPVSVWPDLRDFRANALSLFTDEVRGHVKLVILDRLYKASSGGEPLPLAGAGTTLSEQLTAVRILFPNAKVFFVSDQLLYLREEVDDAIEDMNLPSNIGGYISYAAIEQRGPQGIAEAIKARL